VETKTQMKGVPKFVKILELTRKKKTLRVFIFKQKGLKPIINKTNQNEI